MEFELRRLEEFREELKDSGAPLIGALLCGAHFLEHSLGEANGPLLLLEGKFPGYAKHPVDNRPGSLFLY